ncbi:ATP-dependent DNA helicase MER3 [Clathrospora elynae]|uniref:DNA 3'-5' helicase n=1 Tax=Clathrospora elynae TaxID=706981 RepID=A0A6A5SBV0_9PLEO|nr:ATP-dependent DNA helicase MER3 [Clathrospora elynae]
MGDQYYLPEDLDWAGDPRQASRYDMFQLQFKKPVRPLAPRDRFRATQYDNPTYDFVEDDNTYTQGPQFDSFDDKLLQQPYPDRQRQAAQGRARLSLAPGPSRFLSNAAPAQPQPAYHARDIDTYDGRAEYRPHQEQTMHGQLSRFAYNTIQPAESSSDVQVGPSSSPAFKTCQRRAEQNTTTASQHGPRAQLFENERQCAVQQKYKRPFQQVNPTKPRLDEYQEQASIVQQRQESTHHNQNQTTPKPQPRPIDLAHAPPMCQGIRLVPITTLPDRLRTVFPYPTFNAIQSKCFEKVFRTDDNFVLASPTGSGKTVILELAVCRAVATNATGQYKVVYQAPTKALCSERQRDWEVKFNKIGLKVAELTGDSDASDLRNVQSANIIITTPEKWDSMTRKWKDHEKLMKLIKVFLIDEVHILKEDRGAVLEAVVSRMKSIGTDVRFVALSATVPNFHDVAAWLGKNSTEPDTPAANEKFSEEFRPVKLRKHVCGYVSNSNNDFAFEKVLDARIPDVIATYSESKPIMVFCATRNSTVNTAKLISNWWISKPGHDRMWNPPSKPPPLLNKDLRDTVASGVAFHHAGLDLDDRMQVEKGFIDGEISVICCTSTLAVGVNLPCHLVIIKNTMAFTAEGLQEYSDLEMMQMLGRAGRPQFDDTAVAVIMTRQAKVRRYEMMVTGQEFLESKLHLGLIDHMNAEIGLGTIRDLLSARKWLRGTFLYVRLQQNPEHYKLEGARSGQSIEEQVDDICFRDITLLWENNLVSGQEYFRCTEFGHAMARYYVHFETMKVFIGLQLKSSPSEILSVIAQAVEYSTIRFRQGEKAFYKLLNKSPSIRWAIPVNLDLPAQKVSLIIQSVLGSADISWDGDMVKHRAQYTTETQVVFKKIGSLIRCIIDCQIYLGDSISIHSALMLERSIGARAWDDSPLQMKQLEGIGVVAVRKFVNAGIRCMDDLEACEPHRIEALVGRNPPFGLKLLEKVRFFPKLRVSLHAQPSTIIKAHDGVNIQIKADIGFINGTPPQRFCGKPVYVCLLVETSDGRKIHFARISGPKLGSGQSLVFPALLTSPDQCINCYVMCDGIAGSMRDATVKPQIAPSMFPAIIPPEPDPPHQSNMSKRRTDTAKAGRKRSATSDDFDDDDIDDDALMKASCGDLEFEHIDNYADPTDFITRKNTTKNKSTKDKGIAKGKSVLRPVDATADDDDQEPVQLANGKWACNHPCKDRNACKHLCCKNGMEKPPKKKSTTKRVPSGEDQPQPQQKAPTQRGEETQTKLQLTSSKRKSSAPIEELDLTQQEKKRKAEYGTNGPRDYRDLHQLHKNIQGKDLPSSLHSVLHRKPAYCYSQGGDHNLTFMDQPAAERSQASSDYGDVQFDELSSHYDQPRQTQMQQDLIQSSGGLDPEDYYIDYPATAPVASRGSDTFGDDDSLLGDAMIGLADLQTLQRASEGDYDIMQPLEESLDYENQAGYPDDDYPTSIDFSANDLDNYHAFEEVQTPVQEASSHIVPAWKSRPLFYNSTSSTQPEYRGFTPAKTMLAYPELGGFMQLRSAPPVTRPSVNKQATDVDDDVLDILDMFEDEPMNDGSAKEKPVPDAFKDLEPWLFKEFGDIVELVD